MPSCRPRRRERRRLSAFVGAVAWLAILREVTSLAGRRVVRASPLLLLAAQQVSAQLGREPGVLIGAANDAVMTGTRLCRARGLGTLIGHRRGAPASGALRK